MNKTFRLQNKSSGLWYRIGEHFTASEFDASRLDEVGLAVVRYSYAIKPENLRIVESAPMVACLPASRYVQPASIKSWEALPSAEDLRRAPVRKA